MNAIVFGTNHNNTLGLIRSLGQTGHKVVLMLRAQKINYVDKSKYVSKTVYLDKTSNMIGAITSVARGMKEKPVLFAAGDDEATLIDMHFEELSLYVIPEGGFHNNDINKYRNKAISNKLAVEIGFNLPRTWVMSSTDDLTDDVLFPAFIKANNSIHGGKKVQGICHNRQELLSRLLSLPSEYFPIQVQEFVKKDYEVMLQGCSMNHGKHIVCEVANRKIRFYPNEYSAGSYSYSVQVEGNTELVKLRELLSQYLKRIGYSGLFSAEFLYGNGEFYFLEINLRNDGTAYLSTSCGYNLPDIYCRYLDGQLLERCAYVQQFYMNAIADFHHVCKRHLALFTWLKQFNATHCFSHFNKTDVKPYIFYILSKFSK